MTVKTPWKTWKKIWNSHYIWAISGISDFVFHEIHGLWMQDPPCHDSWLYPWVLYIIHKSCRHIFGAQLWVDSRSGWESLWLLPWATCPFPLMSWPGTSCTLWPSTWRSTGRRHSQSCTMSLGHLLLRCQPLCCIMRIPWCAKIGKFILIYTW